MLVGTYVCVWEREGLKTDQSNFLSEPNADNELVEDSLAKFVKVKRLSSVLIFLDFFFCRYVNLWVY